MANIYKKDAQIILWEKEDGYDYFSINIRTNKDGSVSPEDWIEFMPELDRLNIRYDADEWYLDSNGTREWLKEILLKSGFNVFLGEESHLIDYNDEDEVEL